MKIDIEELKQEADTYEEFVKLLLNDEVEQELKLKLRKCKKCKHKNENKLTVEEDTKL